MDWGLVTHVDPDIQAALIVHVSHLVSKDYAKVPKDLVKLGFVPPDRERAVEGTDVVETLANIYGKWSKGGGTAGLDLNAVLNKVNNLSTKYGNLFQVTII